MHCRLCTIRQRPRTLTPPRCWRSCCRRAPLCWARNRRLHW